MSFYTRRRHQIRNTNLDTVLTENRKKSTEAEHYRKDRVN